MFACHYQTDMHQNARVCTKLLPVWGMQDQTGPGYRRSVVGRDGADGWQGRTNNSGEPPLQQGLRVWSYEPRRGQQNVRYGTFMFKHVHSGSCYGIGKSNCVTLMRLYTECPTWNRPHSLVKYKSTCSGKTLYMAQTEIWQMTLFQNLILFKNHYGNLVEMLEMASFLKYVDLYLTSEWGPVLRGTSCRTSYNLCTLSKCNHSDRSDIGQYYVVRVIAKLFLKFIYILVLRRANLVFPIYWVGVF
jgi:hypothetical protein